jgi:hypothetical protein
MPQATVTSIMTTDSAMFMLATGEVGVGRVSGNGQSMAELCRAVLGEVGPGATFAEAEAWVKANRPGWRYNRSSLRSTLSWQRRLLRGDGAPAAARPSAADLVRAAQVAQQHGGARALRERIREVVELGQRFGTAERLLACLDRLDRLQ